MSKPWQSCSGKKGYRSKTHAMRAHSKAHARIRAYICPECNKWHVTNPDKDNTHVLGKKRRSVRADKNLASESYARFRRRCGMKKPKPTPKDPQKHQFVRWEGAGTCWYCTEEESRHKKESA